MNNIDKRICGRQRLLLSFILGLFLCLLAPVPASAVSLFYDDFTGGADPAWGNELGSWSVSEGTYSSGFIQGNPPVYSSVATLPALTDFAVDLDIVGLEHGGVFLRSSDNNNGVALIFRSYGSSGGFYWHRRWRGFWGNKLGEVTGIADMAIGNSISLHIEVVGNAYSVYLNGASASATSLSDSTYASGRVALYDYSALMSFDNVHIYDFTAEPEIFDLVAFATPVPEPSTYLLLGSGLIGLAAWRRRKR